MCVEALQPDASAELFPCFCPAARELGQANSSVLARNCVITFSPEGESRAEPAASQRGAQRHQKVTYIFAHPRAAVAEPKQSSTQLCSRLRTCFRGILLPWETKTRQDVKPRSQRKRKAPKRSSLQRPSLPPDGGRLRFHAPDCRGVTKGTFLLAEVALQSSHELRESQVPLHAVRDE
jgi:hypothetical protein